MKVFSTLLAFALSPLCMSSDVMDKSNSIYVPNEKFDEFKAIVLKADIHPIHERALYGGYAYGFGDYGWCYQKHFMEGTAWRRMMIDDSMTPIEEKDEEKAQDSFGNRNLQSMRYNRNLEEDGFVDDMGMGGDMDDPGMVDDLEEGGFGGMGDDLGNMGPVTRHLKGRRKLTRDEHEVKKCFKKNANGGEYEICCLWKRNKIPKGHVGYGGYGGGYGGGRGFGPRAYGW